jgi:hypothetical protein
MFSRIGAWRVGASIRGASRVPGTPGNAIEGVVETMSA